MWPYVIYLHHSLGIASKFMKKMMSVPLDILPTPCDNLTSSLEMSVSRFFYVGNLSLDVNITLLLQLMDI